MKFPAVIKHVRKLERARLLRSGSDESDNRKTFYALQSKERVQEIMHCLAKIRNLLASSATFEETARLANIVQASMSRATELESLRSRLTSQIEKCESKGVKEYLTMEEERNIPLWKMMLEMVEHEQNADSRREKTLRQSSNKKEGAS
jgi:predicted transcriptional regulator